MITYKVSDRPKWYKTILFALQQLLAILAATIAVPAIIGNGMSQSAALFGAGVGTIVYLLFTKFKSPVFLGSSFAFLGSMAAAFAGGVSMSAGYLGLIIGAICAGLVYVVIALVVKFAGVKWIEKIMPAVVIGPTVAIIGLSLAGNAVGDMTKGMTTLYIQPALDGFSGGLVEVPTSTYVALICALVTLFTVIVVSVFAKKTLKTIPFIVGIGAGYVTASIFTLIGTLANIPELLVINFSAFTDMQWLPKFTFLTAFNGNYNFGDGNFWSYLGTIAAAYLPVAFVVFAEHIADHKNISSIIGEDLLTEPGIHRTLIGDGVGSMAGAFFGGCPNTTYGESIGCVAISGNASVITILCTAGLAILASFVAPFTTLLSTIPACVMGGVCMTLYGFIAVSGLKMLKTVDLGDNKNLFPAAVILIAGIGGFALTFGSITITPIACALILGVVTNAITHIKE